MAKGEKYFESREAYMKAYASFRAMRSSGPRNTFSQEAFFKHLQKKHKEGTDKARRFIRPVGHVENDVVIIHSNHRHLWPNPHYNVQVRTFYETPQFVTEQRWSRLIQPIIPQQAIPPIPAPQRPSAPPA